MSSRLMVVEPGKVLPGRGRLSTNPIANRLTQLGEDDRMLFPVRFIARAAGVFHREYCVQRQAR